MNALVLGGGGFLGRPLLRTLLRTGSDAVSLSLSGADGGVAVDRRDVDAIRALVRERRFDTVIDLIAYTQADTAPLLGALSGEVGRYLLVSSADVYRNYEGLHRRATPEPWLHPMTEDAPLRTTRHPYRRDPPRAADASDAWLDGYDKIPLETAALSQRGLAATVVRAPMIYGPGDRQRRFRWIIAPMLAGKRELRVDPGWRAWRATYGFVDDVASAVAAAALDPRAEARVFNTGERDPPSHDGWIGRFASTLGWSGQVVDAPAIGGPIAELDLSYPLVTDTTAIREVLGWSEPTPVEDALARTVEDERARG